MRGGVAEKPYSLAIPAFLERNPLLHPFSTTLPLIDPLVFSPSHAGFLKLAKKRGKIPPSLTFPHKYIKMRVGV